MAANGIKSNKNQQCKLRGVYQKLARRCLNIVDDNDNDDKRTTTNPRARVHYKLTLLA